MVCEDVADGYVSLRRGACDYGVVIREVDAEATVAMRDSIRAQRRSWLAEDPTAVAAQYRAGQTDMLDVVRRYGVLLDWGDGTLLPRSTEPFRKMMHRRSAASRD